MPTKYRCTIEDAKDCLALTVECAEDVAKLSRFLLPGTLVEADAVTEPIKYTVEAPAKPAKRTYKPRAAKPAPALPPAHLPVAAGKRKAAETKPADPEAQRFIEEGR